MKKTVIGLTGGIASGKSTVTNYLLQLGYKVIDADAIVHQLQEPHQLLYQAILENFGPDYFEATGQINRKKLAALVFSDSTARGKLSKIQDLVIRQAIKKSLAQVLKSENQLIFLDIPLLLEEHYESLCDEVWLVYLPQNIQLERLMKRSSLTKTEAQARISAQMPLEDKMKLSDIILDNSGTIENLESQIKQQLARLS